jgi:hypothetical protein
MADGSHFARERLMAFTPWHQDAVSGSHPPHLLSEVKRKLDFEPAKGSFWQILLKNSPVEAQGVR